MAEVLPSSVCRLYLPLPHRVVIGPTELSQLGWAGESLTNFLAVPELTLGINALALETSKVILGAAYLLGTPT